MNREEQIKMWQDAINEKVEPKSKPAEKKYDIGGGKPVKVKGEEIKKPDPKDSIKMYKK